MPVVIDASWSRPDGYATWGGLTLRLIGTGGITDLDPFALRVGGHLESSRNAAWIPYGPDLDALLLASFLDVVAGSGDGQSGRCGRHPRTGGRAGGVRLGGLRSAGGSRAPDAWVRPLRSDCGYAPLTRTVRCADRLLSGWIRSNVEEIRRASCRPWAGQLVQGVKAR